MTREEILKRAKECVCGECEQNYGPPEDSFRLIADYWSFYLGTDISPLDVAMMMTLLKIARISGGIPTDDSFVDIAGYAACAGELASPRTGRDNLKFYFKQLELAESIRDDLIDLSDAGFVSESTACNMCAGPGNHNYSSYLGWSNLNKENLRIEKTPYGHYVLIFPESYPIEILRRNSHE